MNRCYFINEISDPVNTISFHGFSDALELAYGACIYIKKKKYSVPRLELLVTFILSKLMVTVLNSLKEEIFLGEFYCYNDSQIALAWILSIDKELKTCQIKLKLCQRYT